MELSDNIHNLPFIVRDKEFDWLRNEMSHTIEWIEKFLLENDYLVGKTEVIMMIKAFENKGIKLNANFD